MKAIACATAILALTSTLSACGGGGGGDDTPNQSAAGFWQGTGKDNRTVWGLAQANGTYWVMMSAPGDPYTLAARCRATSTASVVTPSNPSSQTA
jgi:hypothetical protein